MKQVLWTADGGRLQYQSTYHHSNINWLFLPGGPGLGSESLADLTALLKNQIPGDIWHFDFPNDGSNHLKDKSIANWRSALIQAITTFDKVILVAHSTPGMYVQTMPELENILSGLVLIGSAPDATWQKSFNDYCSQHRDSSIKTAEDNYANNPCNETLRALLIAAAKNCFSTKESIERGKTLFKSLPINHEASDWSAKNFDSENYTATWIPQTIPTLITTGSEDHITPLDLFKNNKAYHRNNILIEEIPGGGHYPWFENPDDTIKLFVRFCSV